MVVRNLAFTVLLVFATMGLLELGAIAAFAGFDDWPSQASIQGSLSDSEESEGAREEPAHQGWSSVLHPYLGYVRNPAYIPKRIKLRRSDLTINEFGFFGISPMSPQQPEVARVVVTGGSVAEEMFIYSRELLVRELEASGAFGGRTVEVVSLAMVGFKQPQQLMIVSYLLLLGAQFDAIVNLDGLNEVVLPFTDIVPMNVAPSYPFRWNALSTNTIDSDTALAVARIGESLAGLEAWREFFSAVPLRHSAFALATWHALKTRFDVERADLELGLRKKLHASAESRPSMLGPPSAFESDDALFDNSVDIWKRASKQLWRLCQSQGVAYLHVLQPNQYVEGAKPFTPSERKIAILPKTNSTRLAAEAGYPRMIAAGADLAKSGLPFLDMTDLFETVEEPIYRDGCCYFRNRGYDMIATRIAQELSQASL